MFKIDNPKNNTKNVVHAFFLALAITIAEPSTILPLMVHHFSESTIIIALFSESFYSYALIFLLFGVAFDGFKISDMNLVIEIAPEDKRPIYSALQVNITSLGLFFPILGGVILTFVKSYTFIYLLTIGLLVLSLYLSFKLKDIKHA